MNRTIYRDLSSPKVDWAEALQTVFPRKVAAGSVNSARETTWSHGMTATVVVVLVLAFGSGVGQQ